MFFEVLDRVRGVTDTISPAASGTRNNVSMVYHNCICNELRIDHVSAICDTEGPQPLMLSLHCKSSLRIELRCYWRIVGERQSAAHMKC